MLSGTVMISGASKNSLSSSSSLRSPFAEQQGSGGDKDRGGCVSNSQGYLLPPCEVVDGQSLGMAWNRRQGTAIPALTSSTPGFPAPPAPQPPPSPPSSPGLCSGTFGRATSACSASGQHSGTAESPLQVVVLLGQLLQRFLQADALIPLMLQRLLPLLAVGLGQQQEIPAGLWGGETG